MASVRLDILAWLFAQLSPLLRSLEIGTWMLPALVRLDSELERLATQLARQGQVPLVTLQALRHQIGGLMHRLERNGASGERLPVSARVPEPAFVMPEVPPAASKYMRRITLWLFGVFAVVALACGVLWWHQVASNHQSQVPSEPVRLDSLSLFDTGSTELKPGSTKVLINALASIKAQSGWLIEIVGHTDSTGNAEQNLQISYARALSSARLDAAHGRHSR